MADPLPNPIIDLPDWRPRVVGNGWWYDNDAAIDARQIEFVGAIINRQYLQDRAPESSFLIRTRSGFDYVVYLRDMRCGDGEMAQHSLFQLHQKIVDTMRAHAARSS